MPLSMTIDFIKIQKHLGRKTLLCLANISENKNQIQLVRIMKALPDDFVAFFLGDELDDGRVRAMCNSTKITEKAILAGFCDEITSIISYFDINVFPSLNDGFGLSIIEGFAYGVPCVTFSDLDAVQDIYNKDAMLLCLTRDDKSFSEIIRMAFSTNWNKEEIKKHGKKFSIEAMAEKYLCLYNRNT